ncbi:helix-turn-helix transcriptional regulator [Lysobacter enzymogenes]|uniref:helix-turn-helix transcriptional regulator n=1 Tax=Lysobacter enzymogenes TaxID=69 RepID=UPI003D18EE7D
MAPPNRTPLSHARSFGHRREAAGFSQEAYADSISMHRTYYSAIERGKKTCSWIPLRRSARG